MNARLAPLLTATLCTAFATLTVRASSGNWPQWRGPDRSDVSKETGLLKTWPEGGPKRVWLFENAGLGYSGYAIVGDKLFTMGLREGGEHLIAVDENTGKELWSARMGEVLKNNWGDGPRGTPSVDGDRVYAMSGQHDEAVKVLAELTRLAVGEYVSPVNMAKLYLGLSESEQAFEWLEKACEERSIKLTWFMRDPALDKLRSDLRFKDLLRRVGLTH